MTAWDGVVVYVGFGGGEDSRVLLVKNLRFAAVPHGDVLLALLQSAPSDTRHGFVGYLCGNGDPVYDDHPARDAASVG